MTNKTKTPKLRLSDLAPKPHRLAVVHPDMGDTGAYVTIISAQSTAYFLKAIQLSKIADDATVEEQIKASAELTATVVIGWDEEFFEKEFTTDALVEMLTDVQWFWLRDLINAALSEKSNFFTKR